MILSASRWVRNKTATFLLVQICASLPEAAQYLRPVSANVGYDWCNLYLQIRSITSHGQQRGFVGFVGWTITVLANNRDLPDTHHIYRPCNNGKSH